MANNEVRVFLSHSTVDRIFTERLAKDLRARGAEPWIHYEHSGRIGSKINQGLKWCNEFVLVYSPSSLASDHVDEEVEAARNLARSGEINGIHTIVAVDVRVTDIPPLWRDYPRFDASKDYGWALDELVVALGLRGKGSSIGEASVTAEDRSGIRRTSNAVTLWAENATDRYAGILNVETEPPGAKVFVNQEEVGDTPYIYTADLVTKAAETVEVAVSLEGYIAMGRSGIVLHRGMSETLSFALVAKPHSSKSKAPGASNPLPLELSYGKLKDKARESGVEMVYIPGGSFQMGDDDPSDRFKDAKPVRTVTLSPYWLSKTPVTVAQFRVFTDDSGYRYDWETNKPAWGWNAHPDYPMVNVSWEDAMAYCAWAGGTLPTEAQWERAAKGPKGTKYPWGDEWNNNLCVNSDNSNKQPAPVLRSDRMYQTSEGLLDMAGNVWQWCRDWYAENYELLKLQDPENTIKNQYRVLRGGSWDGNVPGFIRSAYRNNRGPGSRSFNTGFRLAGL